MPLVSASVDIFLATSVVILIPWLHYTNNFPFKSTGGQLLRKDESPHRTALNVCVLLHSLFILYTFTICNPPNLFTRLRIPLTAPAENIRWRLLQSAGLDASGKLPQLLEILLKKLGSFELRTYYVRFGQAVVQDCEWCNSYYDFALFALPGPLLAYVREAAFLGLLTIRGSHRERLRSIAIGSIICVFVAELYWINIVNIQFSNDGKQTIMWHDLLWTLRHAMFLALPIIIHLLPPASLTTTTPALTLPVSLNILEAAVTRLHLIKFTEAAIMRQPELRERANQWWQEERSEGKWVREDEAVQRTAESLGMPFNDENGAVEEGKLRKNAKATGDALLNGFRPSEHWSR